MALLRSLPACVFSVLLFVIFLFFPVSSSAQSLNFVPATQSVSVGQNFKVSIAVDTKGQKAAGVGVDIIYDPESLAIVSVSPGKLFSDYPEASFDNAKGVADISGIASSLDQQITGYGIFADITFVAKKAGSSKVNFEFIPGSTTDSNIAVTFEPGDILKEAGSLTVTASGTAPAGNIVYPSTSQDEGAVELPEGLTEVNEPGFIDKVLIYLGFKDAPENITSGAPDTNPSRMQTASGPTGESATVLGQVAKVAVVGLLILIIVFVAFKVVKAVSKKGGAKVYQDLDNPPTSP